MTEFLCNDIYESFDETTRKEMLMEYKEMHEIEENKEISKEEFNSYLSNYLDYIAEDFFDNFKGENLIIVGSYGRWDGRFDVCKPISNGEELINFLGQWDFYKVYEEDNRIKIKCADHDGSSYFELKQLRKTFQGDYGNIIDFIRPNTVEKYFKRITKKQMQNFLN